MSKQMICPKAKECEEACARKQPHLCNAGCRNWEEGENCPACVEVEPQKEANPYYCKNADLLCPLPQWQRSIKECNQCNLWESEPSQVQEQCPECGHLMIHHSKKTGRCHCSVGEDEVPCKCGRKPTPTLREQMPLIDQIRRIVSACKGYANNDEEIVLRIEQAVKAEWNRKLEEIAEEIKSYKRHKPIQVDYDTMIDGCIKAILKQRE